MSDQSEMRSALTAIKLINNITLFYNYKALSAMTDTDLQYQA
jgi:hypothetical protein